MTNPEGDYKLVVAVVQRGDAEPLVKALAAGGYGSTVLSSTGGFLRSGNATILALGGAGSVEEIIILIRRTASERVENSSPGLSPGGTGLFAHQNLPVEKGGASIWVLPAEAAGAFRAPSGGSGPREDQR